MQKLACFKNPLENSPSILTTYLLMRLSQIRIINPVCVVEKHTTGQAPQEQHHHAHINIQTSDERSPNLTRVSLTHRKGKRRRFSAEKPQHACPRARGIKMKFIYTSHKRCRPVHEKKYCRCWKFAQVPV